jgi:hypothetical protein
MQDSQTSAYHSALRFVVTSDIPAEHKAVLIEALTQALRDQENAHRRGIAEFASKEWQAHESEMLRSSLQGKIANSWQQADEFVMRIATELHREPQDVRTKATELGFAAGVDFRVAKALIRSRNE